MATAATPVPDAKRLEISVSNFGPIAEGRVELRPFTVFVGPSNTGKSYLAIQLYALHQIFNGFSGMAFRRARLGEAAQTVSPLILEPSGIGLSERDITVLLDWANENVSEPIRSFTLGAFPNRETMEVIELPKPVATLVRSVLGNISDLSESLSNEIARCFGVDNAANLVRHLCGDTANVSLSSYTENGTGSHSYFRYEFGASGRSAKTTAQIPDTTPLRIWPNFILPWFWLPITEEEDKEEKARLLLGNLASAVVANIAGSLSHPAHYLPADRAGVMHAHQVAVRGLIASASRVALRPDSPMPVLSGVLGDFLERLVALASGFTFRGRDGHSHLASRLEQKLMRGTVRVERSQIDYPSFVYRPSGWERDMPLMNASSMVSELAPVVLYLRHVVQPGDTLIIEEPESHLHPTMQVELTRLLARVVQSGVRIIITTHSEWILEELANLVLMSELPEDRREGLGGDGLALSADEVGVWSFNQTDSGTMVEELRFDEEIGKFPSDAGLVTTELYNRFAKISNRIERMKEG